MAIKAETSFSLKDSLFNRDSVSELAGAIAAIHPTFSKRRYVNQALKHFPELELKERIAFLVDALHPELPDDFPAALDVLEAALPEPLNPDLSDDDFGKFIWVVPSEYAAKHGCVDAHLRRSLAFLGEATKRFSAENAIRPFLNNFPEQTMAFVHRWAEDKHYHVRRLASEGIRPLLPWSPRVDLPLPEVIAVLDTLHADPTRYVTRSVANNLNDVSKKDPEAVIASLKRWRRAKRQTPEELDFVTRHALRTLTKQGHSGALSLLGYPENPAVSLRQLSCSTCVEVGDSFVFSGVISSKAEQNLLISLRIHFLKANGKHSAKVFAVKNLTMKKGEELKLSKRLPIKPATTRTLYPGEHGADLVVNGRTLSSHRFQLTA